MSVNKISLEMSFNGPKDVNKKPEKTHRDVKNELTA